MTLARARPAEPLGSDGTAPVTAENILVVIPTYNERDNIASLIRTLLALPLRLTVMVIDDNSPDGTADIAQRLADASGQVVVLRRPGKLGIGSAYLAGFRYGLAHVFEAVVTMDADFSHDPQRLPGLVEAARHADVGVGSRYCSGGAIRQWPLGRRMLSAGANTLARLCLGLTVRDCTSGYRCYRRDVLASFDLARTRPHGYSCLVELLFECEANAWKIVEAPIELVDRKFGVSKISHKEIYKGAWTLVKLSVKRWQRRSPTSK